MFNSIILLAILASIATLVDAQGFYDSCFAPLIQANNRYLFSPCRAHSVVGSMPPQELSTRRSSLLDLGLCLGNDDGRLVRKDGGKFYETCTACHIDKGSAWLSCECTTRSQDRMRTRLDLDDYISNLDGKMCCGADKCSEVIRSWIPGDGRNHHVDIHEYPLPDEIDGFEFDVRK